MTKRNNQRGITLLEYTAGAAIIIGLVWGAMSLMGTNLQHVFDNIASWAQHRADDISSGDGGNGNGGNGN